MIPRVLEPEVMETTEDVEQYDAMDHAEVNARFVADFLSLHGPARGGEFLDVGTGTARIPIALARADLQARVTALDLSEAMLEQAALNIAKAGLSRRVRCHLGDAKSLIDHFGERSFEGVISNSIVHHISDPGPVLGTMARLVAPGGTLFVRDLARPGSRSEIDHLTTTHAGNESPKARALFAASLEAALDLEEIQDLVKRLGLPASDVVMTSDRHWSWGWRNPH